MNLGVKVRKLRRLLVTSLPDELADALIYLNTWRAPTTQEAGASPPSESTLATVFRGSSF